MGEYYCYINIDKKEFIAPSDFGFGSKFIESCYKDNIFLNVLKELLNTDWKNNHIIWVGDYKEIDINVDNEILQKLYQQTVESGYEGLISETIMKFYKNVGLYFNGVTDDTKEEIALVIKENINNDQRIRDEAIGLDISSPFEKLYYREVKYYNFTINHTKKVAYALDYTKVINKRYIDGSLIDPLPMLLAFGDTRETGSWITDLIGVSDELPEGYKLLDEIVIDI